MKVQKWSKFGYGSEIRNNTQKVIINNAEIWQPASLIIKLLACHFKKPLLPELRTNWLRLFWNTLTLHLTFLDSISDFSCDVWAFKQDQTVIYENVMQLDQQCDQATSCLYSFTY